MNPTPSESDPQAGGADALSRREALAWLVHAAGVCTALELAGCDRAAPPSLGAGVADLPQATLASTAVTPRGPMRLTLRTLLAWRDKILEPADREHLTKGLEQSEYAQSILVRIERAVAKHVDDPVIAAGDQGLPSPNLLAEYLDNVIHLDQVAPLEESLLADDACLAELMSCHTVLLAILSQPIDVDVERIRALAYPLAK